MLGGRVSATGFFWDGVGDLRRGFILIFLGEKGGRWEMGIGGWIGL